KPTPGSEPPAAELPELPERWSAGRKTELVLRLLRGETLDAVSRESQVPAHELESWKRVFLEQGTRGLRIRGEPEGRELTVARARLAHRGLQLGGKRVLRLMRAHGLLAPRRLGPPNGDPAHAGTITTTMFGRRPGAPCSDTANTSVPWKEALQDTIRLYPSPGD